jgi:rubrerythrin
MFAIRRERTRKGLPVDGIEEEYPSQYAGSTKYPEPEDRRRPQPGEQEPRAIKCGQCGFPIEDYSEISACPFCESDNFLGRNL